jgi:hypothetical protein
MTTLRIIIPGSGNAFENLGLGNYATPFKVKPYALYPLASSLLMTGQTAGQDLLGGSPLVAVGSPVASAQYSSLSQNNYWKTPWTGASAQSAGDGSGLTMAVVYKAPANSDPTQAPTTVGHLIGNYDSVATIEEGISLISRNGTGTGNLQAIQSVSGGGTGQNGSNVNGANADPYRADHWTFALMTAPASGLAHVWAGWSAYTPGAVSGDTGAAKALVRSGTNGTATATRTGGPQALGIGGAPWSGNYPSGVAHVAFAGIWNRVVSDSEVGQIYSDARAWLADAGIDL